MTRSSVRNFSLVLGLVSILGASLACANPRRGSNELPTPAVQVTEAATAAPATTEPFPTAIPSATDTAIPAPTDTTLPPTATVAPSDTTVPPTTAPAATATTAADDDVLGGQIEALLDQFDQASDAEEAALNQLPGSP